MSDLTLICPDCGGWIEHECRRSDLTASPNEGWRIYDPSIEDPPSPSRRWGQPTVYVMLSEGGEALYVGSTGRFFERWREHRRSRGWWPCVHSIAAVAQRSKGEAWALERRLIQQLHPTYNIRT